MAEYTVSDVGIGDDAVQTKLERFAEELREMQGTKEVSVETDILAGAAHIDATFTRSELPKEQYRFMLANGLAIIHVETNEPHRLRVKLTTTAIYEKVAEMAKDEYAE